MKKCIIALAICACAVAAFAAFDVTKLTTVDVLAPTAITANATNSTEFAISGFKGKCEIVLNATPALGRTVNATIYGRNSTSEAWRAISATSNTATNSVVVTVPFYGEYVPSKLKLAVSPTANATVSAFVLGNK